MSFQSSPLQAAINNAASTYSPFQRGGMDGSNGQINNNQQGNRTITQGDQAGPSNGGTGGTQGGAAGPGGGSAGAAGAAIGTAGGSNGAAGGPPIGGQETGRVTVTGNLGLRISYDQIDPEVLVVHHSGAGESWSDMSGHSLYSGPREWDTVERTDGCTICKVKAFFELIVSILQDEI